MVCWVIRSTQYFTLARMISKSENCRISARKADDTNLCVGGGTLNQEKKYGVRMVFASR